MIKDTVLKLEGTFVVRSINLETGQLYTDEEITSHTEKILREQLRKTNPYLPKVLIRMIKPFDNDFKEISFYTDKTYKKSDLL